MMKHELLTSTVHGSAATFAVTLVGMEAFGVKLIAGVIVAAISTTVSFFIQRWLRGRFDKDAK